MKSKYINLVAAPSVGKSTVAASIFAELKMMHESAEIVPEHAKWLIYKGEFEKLNDQYMVSKEQYKMLKALKGQVNWVVVDSPLVLGMYYNRTHQLNTSNVEKTENMIKQSMNEFDNIYIFLERNPQFQFEKNGRIHNEEESRKIDVELKKLLDEQGLVYKCFLSGRSSVPEIMEYILSNK